MQNDNDTNKLMAKLDGEEAARIQQEELDKMTQNEIDQKRLRIEWRLMLENGYDEDIEERKQRALVEKKEVYTGPTSID